MVVEATILDGFLKKLTEEALKQVEREGSLTQQNALPLLIQEQYSKISRIEREFVCEETFLNFQQEFVEFRHEMFQFKKEMNKFTDEMIQFKHDVISKFISIDARFNSLDSKFASYDGKFASFDAKFSSVDTQLIAINHRFDTLYKILGLGFAFISILIGFMGYIH